MSDPRAAYYQRATSWALDAQGALLGSLRRARIAAGVFALIAILEAFALLLLTPLKTVVTLPVLVDRQTGFVQTLKPDGRQELQADAALTQSMLAQYVIAREGFDAAEIGADYRKVTLWSDGQARRDYLAMMPASNPASPLRRYPRTTVVETRVKSVSPLGPQTALIRFETRRRDQGGPASAPIAWVAVIGWRFSNAPLSMADRLLDPLGFEVTSYRRDPEAVDPAEPQAPAAPAVTTATAVLEAAPLPSAVPVAATPPAAPPKPDPGQPGRTRL